MTLYSHKCRADQLDVKNITRPAKINEDYITLGTWNSEFYEFLALLSFINSYIICSTEWFKCYA